MAEPLQADQSTESRSSTKTSTCLEWATIPVHPLKPSATPMLSLTRASGSNQPIATCSRWLMRAITKAMMGMIRRLKSLKKSCSKAISGVNHLPSSCSPKRRRARPTRSLLLQWQVLTAATTMMRWLQLAEMCSRSAPSSKALVQ